MARLSRLVLGRHCVSPRGAVHRFDNLGSEDVKQLAVICPAIMGPAYFREAAEVMSAAGGGPPDREKMMNVFRRHGMTVAAPPLTDECNRDLSQIIGASEDIS